MARLPPTTFLAPPAPPRPGRWPGRAANLLSLVVLGLAGAGWIATIASVVLAPDFASLQHTDSNYALPYLALDFVMVSGTFAGLAVLLVRAIRHRLLRIAGPAQERWAAARRAWERTFYCRECAGTFEPGDLQIKPLDSFVRRTGGSAGAVD
jgi:hypothetical protein